MYAVEIVVLAACMTALCTAVVHTVAAYKQLVYGARHDLHCGYNA
jgi:hypothetical protein